MHVIEQYFPNWRSLVVHESSPATRGASVRLARECPNYVGSQYFPGEPLGSMVGGTRCENLEALSFASGSVDLHVTQDVMEHVFDPAQAFKEIARTLKPGGAHVFTVPIVIRRAGAPRRRALLNSNGTIEHLLPPKYHGNPISGDGALVTIDWSFDICREIHVACGLFTTLIQIDDLSRGIRAELNDVLVTSKPA